MGIGNRDAALRLLAIAGFGFFTYACSDDPVIGTGDDSTDTPTPGKDAGPSTHDSGSPPSHGDDDGGDTTNDASLPEDDGATPPDDGGTGPDPDAAPKACTYTDDATYCSCMGWDCGGTTVTSTKNAAGDYITVYCGSCSAKPGTYCQANTAGFTGVGKCGGNNPIVYPYQRQLINMLEAMGENDTTDYQSQYKYIQNIKDGRGYTIGTVGFCSGTGDFIVVARCLNDVEPTNILAKYWPGLVTMNNQYYSTSTNIGDTSPVDKLGTFTKDVASAGTNDKNYRDCQDTMGDADYMAAALAHAQAKGLKGALTIGFLYDTELNFGEDDDPGGVAGAATVIKKADADYGPGLPTDFTGKPWEESRWLGFLIKERTIVMATDPQKTWQQDMDQNATWEAARRLHTAATNNPESATDLSMAYDFVSAYKAGAGSGPCWPSLPDKTDAQSSIFDIAPVKTGTSQSTWTAANTGKAPKSYAACPANPTP